MKDTMGLRDTAAEDAVLCGILHEPHEMFRELAKFNFTADDFGHHHQMVAFIAIKEMWSRGKLIDLVCVWNVLKNDGEFGNWKESALWLIDLWDCCWWDERIAFFWINNSCLETGYGTRGLAAAAKVKWLAARRNAIYRANEVIRDALDGVSGPDSYEDQL